MFPPIQAKSAENNRCAANEGIVWFDVRLREASSRRVRPVIVRVWRGREREREGRVCLGQVDREVNTVAVSVVAMTALLPPQGLWLCECVWGGRGL